MHRFNGRFCKKNIVKWRQNVIKSNKARIDCRNDNCKIKNCNYCKRKEKKFIELDGRRFIDIKLFDDDMWCHSCQQALALRNSIDESKNGLASTFHVKCTNCNKFFLVNTSTTEKNSATRPTYTINSKIVNGVIESGIGNTHLNKILTAAEVPVMYSTVFKRHEKKVGVAIESLADESCLENLIAEREATIEKEGLRELSNWAESNVVYLTISYDAGWQKKGSGRSYNSLTGHGTAIGFYTEKVIGFATRNKRCRFCESMDKKSDIKNSLIELQPSKTERKEHDCRKDFDGSSKAMEADIAREIFQKNPHFIQVNVKLGTLIGDDDSSTIATLRKEANYEIHKWSDKNHAVSKLSKCLYAIKLSTQLVKYFKYCFSCVLEKKNNTEATKAGLLNIVPHAYDDHSGCGDWCKYKLDPDNYKHKVLPGGKGLTDAVAKEKLKIIFNSFANVADKLSPCASSQANESLNKTIASTAPKHLHYGGSSSNDIRASAAIVHKNLGNTTIVAINKKMDSSPTTTLSIKFRLKKDEIENRRKIKAKTVQFKKRRRELFSNKTKKCNKAVQKEGICYESGYGLDLGIDFVDSYDAITEVDLSSSIVVFFYLETTGLGTNKEIVQIAAKYSNIEFDIYIKPLQGFTYQASEITGLTIKNNELYYNSTPVITHSKIDAANSFLQFLKSINNKIILMAHNCFRFDCPAILNFIKKQGLLKEFSSVVIGFSDSIPLFKAKLKDRHGVKVSYKQEVLAQEFLDSNLLNGAHNAANDVNVLQKLVEHDNINITREEIFKNFRSIHEIMRQTAKKVQSNKIQEALLCLKSDKNKKEVGGLSINMINKIATARITFDNLCQCYTSSGGKGIRILLAQDVGGKPRITKSQKIIDNLCTKLDCFVSNS